MRVLFFILMVFTINVAAQTPFQQKIFDEGMNNARHGEFEKASEDFRRTFVLAGIEKSSDEFLARVHYNLGVCFYRLDEAKKAVGEFAEAIKLSHRNYQKAFYALGMAQGDLKNWDEAEAAFRDALKLDKTDGEAWFDLAFVYLRKKNLRDAEKAFEKAIEHKSRAASDAYNNIGVIYVLTNDFPSAEIQFEKALFESGGKSVTAKNNLQFCRQLRQNFNRELVAKLEFKR